MRLRTFHVELVVVGAVLAIGVVAGGSVLAWFAVMLTFAHAQVADRLAAGVESGHDVECRRWLDRYQIAKEVLWLVYFIESRAWPAAIGAVVFAAYPAWRRWWRARSRR